MPRDHPIIFSAPMVRALLDGRKTQTRRLATSPLRRVQPGDRLWVRETWSLWSSGHDAEISYPADANERRWQTGPNTGKIPDARLVSYFRWVDRSVYKSARINVPAIHMPRWASRLTLNVAAVRTEQLQAIRQVDAAAEGVEFNERTRYWLNYIDPVHECRTSVDSYCTLWCSLHGRESWDANPEVVVLTFTVEQPA